MSDVATASRPVNARWTGRELSSVLGMAAFILLLHVVGWGVLVLAVAPHNYMLGSAGVFGVGLGLTAYLLGVRHAFDADHIAVVDNTTRKLVGEGRPASGAGFWFSLGHSSVVFGLSLVLALGVRALVGPVQDEDSALLQTLGLIGSVVAGTFLIFIGLTNLVAVLGIARVIRRMRSGVFDEASSNAT
jgi:high-affinity nickel-transport protein